MIVCTNGTAGDGDDHSGVEKIIRGSSPPLLSCIKRKTIHPLGYLEAMLNDKNRYTVSISIALLDKKYTDY